MKVAYISDVHIDSWVKSRDDEDRLQSEFFDLLEFLFGHLDIQKHGCEALIIAGDLSHYNDLTKRFLEMMREVFPAVLVVPGNHDYYLIRENAEKYNNYSSLRIKELKEICSELDVHFLDGQIVEINDKKFAGTMGSWDMSYYLDYYKREFTPTENEIKQYWLNGINDSNFMMDGMKPRLKSNTYEWGDRGLINHFNIVNFSETEFNKIKNYNDYDNIDVMVTHYAPIVASNLPEHYKIPSTTFFCYNGIKDLERIQPKFWIFGHQHFVVNDTFENRNISTKILCNPLGYKGEIFWIKPDCKFKFFEI